MMSKNGFRDDYFDDISRGRKKPRTKKKKKKKKSFSSCTSSFSKLLFVKKKMMNRESRPSFIRKALFCGSFFLESLLQSKNQNINTNTNSFFFLV